MRSTSVLALAVLSACAAKAEPADWRSVQQERLARLHARPSAAAAVAAVIAHDPRSAPQDAHIDQRAADGQRSYRADWQPLVAGVQVGAGSVRATVPGTQLHDRTSAHFLRAMVENGTGAGLAFDVWSSDASLFQGRRLNDGQAPAPADATFAGFDAFPHQRFDVGSGDFRMPVRVGGFLDWQRLEHDPAGVEREFLGFGPRLQIEPTWRLLANGNSALELFARVGGDGGIGFFSETFQGGTDQARTIRGAGDFGGGLRGTFGHGFAEIGYRWQQTWIGAIDSDLYGDRGSTDLQRQQLFLGFGVSY